MHKQQTFYFIDQLNVMKLCCDVLPAMWKNLWRHQCVLFCVESSRSAQTMVKMLKWVGIEYRDLHFRLMDTAGIRTTEDLVEQEGIRRSKDAMQNSC